MTNDKDKAQVFNGYGGGPDRQIAEKNKLASSI